MDLVPSRWRGPIPGILLLLFACKTQGPQQPFAKEEAALVEALVPFCESLGQIPQAKEVFVLPPLKGAEKIAQTLRPQALALRSQTALYEGLPELRKPLVFAKVNRRCRSALSQFYGGVATLSQRFGGEHKDQYRPALRVALAPFVEQGTLWAFGLFSQEALVEITEALVDKKK